MTDKEAIDNLKNYIECLMEDYGYYKDIVEFRDSVEHLEKSLQTQQAEIEKKDKIIDLTIAFIAKHYKEDEDIEKFAKEVMERGEWTNLSKILREYFERKLEENN